MSNCKQCDYLIFLYNGCRLRVSNKNAECVFKKRYDAAKVIEQRIKNNKKKRKK